MNRSAIHTDDAPAAIGTYSQAIVHGDTVYLSGQIPLDPATMELVTGDMRAQVVQVFRLDNHVSPALPQTSSFAVSTPQVAKETRPVAPALPTSEPRAAQGPAAPSSSSKGGVLSKVKNAPIDQPTMTTAVKAAARGEEGDWESF